MKTKFVVIGLIFTLLVSFSFIAGFSSNHEDEKAFTKASSKTAVAAASQDQKKKKEVYVYITKTGKKYHKETCRYLKKSKIKITLEEACKRGYTLCKVCKPPKCPDK
jgi:uncharacterized protein (UPF0333 family)